MNPSLAMATLLFGFLAAGRAAAAKIRVHVPLWKSGLIALGLLLTGSLCFASTLRVPAEYASIQAGIDAAAEGDTVLVAPGTYGGLNQRVIIDGPNPLLQSFHMQLKSELTVRSEEGPDATILDVTGDQFQSHTVYVLCSGVSDIAVEGFTFQGGSPYLSGIDVYDSDPVRIDDCKFLEVGGNAKDNGSSAATLIDSTVEFRGTQFLRCPFGAVYSSSTILKMIGCEVEGSYVSGHESPAVLCYALQGVSGLALLFQDCVFRGNVSTGWSGAIVTFSPVFAQRIERCVFVDNVGAGNAAVSMSGNNAVIRDCVFARNRTDCDECSAGTLGGGHDLEVTGCVFWGNSNESSTYGGSAVDAGHNVHMARNVFEQNSGGPAVSVLSFAPSSGCNVYWENPDGAIEGVAPLPTDIFLNPQFCDPASEDFTLQSTSPCLPENNGGCGLIGVYGVGCGSVPVESKSWGGIKALFRGDPSSR